MRLIDADALQGCAIIMPTTHEDMSHILACKGLIKHGDIPPVEAVPVVHGEWMSGHGTLFPVYRCSKCSWANALGQTKFCPNCGADMRKKV